MNTALLNFFKNTEFGKGLKATLLLILGFTVAHLPGHSTNAYGAIFKVSMAYGLSIWSMIYLSFITVEGIIDRYEAKNKTTVSFGLAKQLATCMLGLIPGALIGQNLKAIILGREVDYSNTLYIILLGTLISLMFIYKDLHSKEAQEKEDLENINKKLQELKEKKYLENLPSKIGGSTKLIKVNDILYFQSIDHYTYAFTSEGDFIVDYSIKALSENLDPDLFIQIHRGSIINKKSIDSISSGDAWVIKTKTGASLPVSRGNRSRLKNALN